VVTTKHFDDDYLSMMGRLGRLKTRSAWTEDPPSRSRRLVTNILVWHTDRADELEVRSNLLLARCRYENYEYQLLTAARTDVLRRMPAGGFRIARREVIVDQSSLGVPNLSVFL
jgi:3-phenylpropionate/cinnamic acid dioxygenase small subunit